MAEDGNNPSPTDPQDGGQGAANSTELHKVLGKELGKEFPNDEAALKAVKDTFSHVGKAGKMVAAVEAVMKAKGLNEDQAIDFIKGSGSTQEPQQDQTKSELAQIRAEMRETNFYADNPNYKDYKDIIKTFQKANPDKSLEEIVGMQTFKDWFDGAQEAKQKQKSILHSNPKIQASEDKLTKAREGLAKGNIEEAKAKAVEAVMEAHGMRE